MSKTIEPDMGLDLNQLNSNRTRNPIHLTWENIVVTATIPAQKRCCKVLKPETEKQIIKGVSGTVPPGQFLAIIGASGAGKTTLLNFLSGRENSKLLRMDGDIRLNGTNKRDMKSYSMFSAFVQQDDVLFQTMTVRECLEFAARLKLPGSEEDRLARVNQVISQLKLTKCQATRIGGPLVKGISGGERKRTSIGVELITDPSLIFLDEPTTGLDSFTATSVMEILGDLARNDNRTVISTIHQPNTDIFNQFDRLMLLTNGKVIFLGEASTAVDYFSTIGYVCPNQTNPADYFMDIMSKESVVLENESAIPKENRFEAIMAKYNEI
jgi:ABC-type multidrug transport system ATPase subunit